jgi:osmotically-inducible protein OsmY
VRNLKPLYALASVFFMAALLPGCAVERKCGLAGCPGDAKITADVQVMIDHHTDVGPPNSVHVQTLDHVVYLSGEVSEGNMKQTAETVALQSPGVTRVVNNIFVSH